MGILKYLQTKEIKEINFTGNEAKSIYNIFLCNNNRKDDIHACPTQR